MRRPKPSLGDRFAVAWSLVETSPSRIEEVEEIDLTDAVHQTEPEAHCPACQCDRIDTAVTADDRRFDRCLGCGRLWEIRGSRRRLVVGGASRATG